jgi:glycosyltransferase involved in cell wall biosynthesis
MSSNDRRNESRSGRFEMSAKMNKRKPKLLVVPGIDFDRSYAGTHYLLERLAGDFEIALCVFTDRAHRDWYRRLPFKCQVFPFMTRSWNGRRTRFMSKIFRLFIGLRMLFARRVLITETTYLREAALAKKIMGSRMVLTQFCQELFLPEEYPGDRWPATQKRLARAPDIVIDVDPFRAKIRAEYYGLETTPHVLRNTFPLAQMPPPAPRGGLWALARISPPPAAVPVLVHAGGVGREKPFERIIDAVAELERPPFLLAFCSASEADIRRLREYASQKLRPGGYFLGASVPRESLRASLWEADIGVVDYTFSVEPTVNQRHCAPTKLYEFMACGLAILGSNNDSLRDVIEREEIGCCAKDDAPRDLALALKDLLGRDMAKMKERAKASFADKYSYETACEAEVERIAQEMVSKGRSRERSPRAAP